VSFEALTATAAVGIVISQRFFIVDKRWLSRDQARSLSGRMKQLPSFRVFHQKLISVLFEWHSLLGFSPGLQALVNEIQLVLHAAVLHFSRTDLASRDAPPPPIISRAP
jgi:hypothetical protein